MRAPIQISSPSNAFFKLAKSLLQAKGIEEQRLCLVAGKKIVQEMIEAHGSQVKAIIYQDDHHVLQTPDLKISTYICAKKLFSQLDCSGTQAPLLLVDLPTMERFDPNATLAPGCTLLLPFQDPENMGAAIRAAAALGAARVVCLKSAAHPFLPRSVRAAGPALFRIPLMMGPHLEDLHVLGSQLLVLDSRGEPLHKIKAAADFALCAGMEGPGVPDTLRGRAQLVSIKMQRDLESLNAATSVAVALYELCAPKL